MFDNKRIVELERHVYMLECEIDNLKGENKMYPDKSCFHPVFSQHTSMKQVVYRILDHLGLSIEIDSPRGPIVHLEKKKEAECQTNSNMH